MVANWTTLAGFRVRESRQWSELRVALSAFFAACNGQREPVFQAEESDDHAHGCA